MKSQLRRFSLATIAAKPHGYPYRESANPHWVAPPSEDQLAHIPGEQGLPFVGTTLKVIKDPIGFGKYMFERYGSVYRTYSFGKQNVMLLGADATELVMFNKEKIFSSEQGWGPVLNNLFPRGLMLMDFERHRADRKALSVAFKPGPMKHHCAVLGEGILERVADWGGTEFEFYPAIKSLSLDTAASAILGIPWGPEADKINKAFVDEVQASVGIARSPIPFTKMWKGVKAREYLLEYFTPQVKERRAKGGEDIFTQICLATHENGELLTEDEVVDHMNFLMMAAHDTITSSATSMTYLLAKHPEWQERLREECLAVAPAGTTLTLEQLGKLELTEMAFKESLRMIPPVPSIPRRALKEFTFRNYTIPAGTNIGISPQFVHKMEKHWPEPEKFDPLRFTPENSAGRHKYAWVPFGGGAHMCLGLHFAYMQIKILMHAMLTQNRVVLQGGPDYEPKWQVFPIPQPRDGLPVRLERL
ncbi:MAG: cytochrome P450 [Sphingomonadales bacterium]|nr:cytochrome P450 [Sphingomonadales bacterium]NCO49892.1 cytochrome P450 [Sphingomonadales bacterium]NCP00955.1 cytochrome P450 [Sphingomonadales bacterium]NCP27987.1 cytochrome P450 [Sphingomonadales bacterium]NCP42919.1 cytochrome P450 [Sphingomonadales bacterium]